MNSAKIIWVTPSEVSEDEIEKAVQCGIDGIQLRCKKLSIKALLPLAKAARAITYQADKQLTINSAIEVAEKVGADGIHLPESMIDLCYYVDSLPVNVSVHSLEAALRAQAKGASMLTFGPIFQTASKQIYGPPQGLQKLEEVVGAVSVPVYAIGGINPNRLETCLKSGACAVMIQNEKTLLHYQ